MALSQHFDPLHKTTKQFLVPTNGGSLGGDGLRSWPGSAGSDMARYEGKTHSLIPKTGETEQGVSMIAEPDS